jgi:alpha-galactosidase
VQTRVITGDRYSVEIVGSPDVLWRYVPTDADAIEVAPPAIEVDGESTVLTADLLGTGQRVLPNRLVEHDLQGFVPNQDGLRLRLVLRVAPGSTVIRFRYEAHSDGKRLLTKATGRDAMRLAAVALPSQSAVEVRLSDYNSLVHSYVPTEVELGNHDFSTEQLVMGPLLRWSTPRGQALLAYEHGSQYPDAYLGYRLSVRDGGLGSAEVVGVKGTYLSGHDLQDGYATAWMELASVAGDLADLQRAYRDFVLRWLSTTVASRTPLIFYNTWNYQERVKHWTRRPYLADMSAERILAEIDVAHRLGIDVFVIDTGWYDRTGDWRVDPERFPDGLRPIKERLDGYGMRLGLWFGPTSAAVSSELLKRNQANRMSWRGERRPARPIWETEESEELCLVSSYADDFAAELIRCAREFGVTYFKWDAIDQYGCDDPHHHHGTEANSPEERADAYAYAQPLALARIAEQLTTAVPEAIVDFDVTEAQRCVGLAFLTAGKYFLINNGPYLSSYDVPTDRDLQFTNSNLFFYPGPARDWVCRTPLAYDSWIPSVLFLTHYLPDDPAANQNQSVGSLILGQNGIWGDLLSISDKGVDRIGRLIAAYKQVRVDVTTATAIRTGVPGGMVETYEKIDATTGRGVFVAFANQVRKPVGPDSPLVAEAVTHAVVDRCVVTTPNVEVRHEPSGRAVIRAEFAETGAAIVIFGANRTRAGPHRARDNS